MRRRAAVIHGWPRAASSRRAWRFTLLLMVFLILPPAHAHFRLNTSIRIVHLERLGHDLVLSMRLPATLAFAEYAGMVDGEIATSDISWVADAMEDGERVHYLDTASIAADTAAFAAFVAGGYRLTADGATLPGKTAGLRIHTAAQQTRFTTRDEVDASFAGPVFVTRDPLYVGDAVIDLRLRYPAPGASAVLRLSSTLASTLPPETFIANLLIGHTGGEQRITRVTGQLVEPVELAPTRLSAVKSFVGHGFGHILGGPDHLLFVLCLAIGAGTPAALLWRVTGFTIGHTLSLAAGIAGYAPQQAWLVYVVEILIALSIVYVSTLALRRTSREHTLLVTTCIGVLHGLGFSVLLSQLLGADSPHLVMSLLSFNAGIEIAQVLVVVVTLAFLFSLGRISDALRRRAVTTLASASLCVGGYWMLARTATLLGAA